MHDRLPCSESVPEKKIFSNIITDAVQHLRLIVPNLRNSPNEGVPPGETMNDLADFSSGRVRVGGIVICIHAFKFVQKNGIYGLAMRSESSVRWNDVSK
jgi:hypothetical protein